MDDLIEKEQQIITKLSNYSTLLYLKERDLGENITLGECCDIKTGKLNADASVKDGLFPFFTCGQAELTINEYAFGCEAIIISGNGEISVKYYSGKFNAYQRTYVLTPSRYFFLFLKECELNINNLKNNSQGSVIKFITKEMLQKISIKINSKSSDLNYKLSDIYKIISIHKRKIQKLNRVKQFLLDKYF